MKANAPEKLYFTATENGTHYYTEGIPFERDYIEYTRTDAFIEKACEWLEKNTFSELNLDFGYSLQIKELVDEFRKYMKGE